MFDLDLWKGGDEGSLLVFNKRVLKDTSLSVRKHLHFNNEGIHHSCALAFSGICGSGAL